MSAVAAAVIGGGSVVVGAYGAHEQRKASEAGAAATERAAEQQLEFEKERFAEEGRRWEMNRIEEQRRYRSLTAKEQQRYNEMKSIEQGRYNAMTDLEQQRYDERKAYYDSLNAEEKQRYQAAIAQEQQRYETELARVQSMTEEEKRRYADQLASVDQMTDEERQRYNAYSDEEKLRYARGVRFAEATTSEEQRRWESLTDEERQRYETQLAGQRERYGRAEEALRPAIQAADVARQQLQVELGLAPGEAGTAYMESPAYKAALDERTRQVEQEMANMGAAYSGRRVEEAAKAGGDVQTQFYQNYMNMLGAMASPQTAQTLASLGVGQANISGQLPGIGAPGAGGIPGGGAMTMGQPNAPIVSGSPYLGGPSGSTMYASPGVGQMPSGSLVSGQLPGYGSLSMGNLGGTGAIPSVGSGLVNAANIANQYKMQSAMAYPNFMQDVMGMGANIYGGYLAGGGGGFGGGTTATPVGQYGPMAGGYAWG